MSIISGGSATSPKIFLPHLEGLRGIAILLVVLFHLSDRYCCNGYVGVDVFLVMSGYLLGRSLNKLGDEADFTTFAKAKIRRLYPPMLVCVSLVLLAAALIFPPQEWVQTSKLAINAVCSTANWWLDASAQGYFAADTKFEPLMHLWYLSVTLQGMLAVYLLHTAKRHIQNTRLRRVAWGALAVFAAAGIFLLNWDALVRTCAHFHCTVSLYIPHTYYWSVCRIAEMLCGYLFFFYLESHTGLQDKLARCGGAVAYLSIAVLLCCAFMHELRNLPLIPVFAALCLISTGGKGNLILENSLIRFIGRVSFSLYIIHWPIISFWKYATHQALGMMGALSLAAMLGLLTLILYRWVESKPVSFGKTAAWCAACVGMASLVIGCNGFVGMFHPHVAFVSDMPYIARAYADQHPIYNGSKDLVAVQHRAPMIENDMLDVFRLEPRKFYILGDGTQEADFVLIGDSHAESIFPGIDNVSREEGWHGAYMHVYMVPFWNIVHNYPPLPWQRFDAFRWSSFLQWLECHPEIKTVVIAQYWSERFSRNVVAGFDGCKQHCENSHILNLEALRATCRQIQGAGRRVVLLTDCPQLSGKYVFHPEAYANWARLWGTTSNVAELDIPEDRYNETNAGINKELDSLEKEGLCRVVHLEQNLFQEGKFEVCTETCIRMKDTHHFSIYGATEAVRNAARQFAASLKPPAQE